jgi:addiction module RelE/StbE family toxin
MARRVILSPSALADLREIAGYIANDSPRYSSTVIQSFFEATDRLKLFPRIGRVVPELDNPDIREVLVYSYRVIYHLHEGDSVIRVVAVIHGARDLPRAIKGRDI